MPPFHHILAKIVTTPSRFRHQFITSSSKLSSLYVTIPSKSSSFRQHCYHSVKIPSKSSLFRHTSVKIVIPLSWPHGQENLSMSRPVCTEISLSLCAGGRGGVHEQRVYARGDRQHARQSSRGCVVSVVCAEWRENMCVHLSCAVGSD